MNAVALYIVNTHIQHLCCCLQTATLNVVALAKMDVLSPIFKLRCKMFREELSKGLIKQYLQYKTHRIKASTIPSLKHLSPVQLCNVIIYSSCC